MIYYEIPLVMSVIGIVLLAGSLNLNEIVAAQEKVWYIFVQPIGFVVFLIAAVAELIGRRLIYQKRSQNLFLDIIRNTQGFAGRFSMLSEYVCFFGMASLITVLFFRRLESSYVFLGLIPGAVWFALKFSSVVFLLIWFRVTFPRIRGDQLMEFGWKVLLPYRTCKYFLNGID